MLVSVGAGNALSSCCALVGPSEQGSASTGFTSTPLQPFAQVGDKHHECLRDIFTNLAAPNSRFVNMTMQFFASCIAQNTATSLGFGSSPDSRSSLFGWPSPRNSKSPPPALELEEPTRVPESDETVRVAEPGAPLSTAKASSPSPAVEPQNETEDKTESEAQEVKSAEGPESEDEDTHSGNEPESEDSEAEDTPISESATPSLEAPVLNWQNITNTIVGAVSNIIDNLTPTEQDGR